MFWAFRKTGCEQKDLNTVSLFNVDSAWKTCSAIVSNNSLIEKEQNSNQLIITIAYLNLTGQNPHHKVAKKVSS